MMSRGRRNAVENRPTCPIRWERANPGECVTYTLGVPVHVAIRGAGTQGQMEDKIRAVQTFKPLSPADLAEVRRRAVAGQGVCSGTTME